jgi:hypothetical protein
MKPIPSDAQGQRCCPERLNPDETSIGAVANAFDPVPVIVTHPYEQSNKLH